MTLYKGPVLLYDGECKFCNASIDFVLKHEKNDSLKFLWLQSKEAQSIIDSSDILSTTDSIILVESGLLHYKSNAALSVSSYLKAPYSWLKAFKIVPRTIRDFVYDIIAKHRKKIMGSTTCALPIGKEHRFL